MLSFGHRELVDRKPVVALRRVEVDHAGLVAGDAAIGAAILHRDAIHQHAMHGAVPLGERGRFGPGELPARVLQCLGRQIRVETQERLPQAAFQHHGAVPGVPALGARFAGGDGRAVQHGVAELAEPGEGGVLDD